MFLFLLLIDLHTIRKNGIFHNTKWNEQNVFFVRCGNRPEINIKRLKWWDFNKTNKNSFWASCVRIERYKCIKTITWWPPLVNCIQFGGFFIFLRISPFLLIFSEYRKIGFLSIDTYMGHVLVTNSAFAHIRCTIIEI